MPVARPAAEGITHFGSMFSGAGGMDLGLERAGFRCAWQVEIDGPCRSVLAHHWPDVPRGVDRAASLSGHGGAAGRAAHARGAGGRWAVKTAGWREICRCCGRTSPVGFHVPDEVWRAAVPVVWGCAPLRERPLCIMCFAHFADEAGVEWDCAIEFFPVSLVSHLELADSRRRQEDDPLTMHEQHAGAPEPHSLPALLAQVRAALKAVELIDLRQEPDGPAAGCAYCHGVESHGAGCEVQVALAALDAYRPEPLPEAVREVAGALRDLIASAGVVLTRPYHLSGDQNADAVELTEEYPSAGSIAVLDHRKLAVVMGALADRLESAVPIEREPLSEAVAGVVAGLRRDAAAILSRAFGENLPASQVADSLALRADRLESAAPPPELEGEPAPDVEREALGRAAVPDESAGDAIARLLRPPSEGACAAALRELVEVIDAAGLMNLSRGVQLGPTVWYVKASDAVEAARSALTEREKPSVEADIIAVLARHHDEELDEGNIVNTLRRLIQDRECAFQELAEREEGTLDRLAHVRNLAPGWDSYSAIPPSPQAIATAEAMLLPPAIAPTVVGGLQLQWPAVGVEVEIAPSGRLAEEPAGPQSCLAVEVEAVSRRLRSWIDDRDDTGENGTHRYFLHKCADRLDAALSGAAESAANETAAQETCYRHGQPRARCGCSVAEARCAMDRPARAEAAQSFVAKFLELAHDLPHDPECRCSADDTPHIGDCVDCDCGLGELVAAARSALAGEAASPVQIQAALYDPRLWRRVFAGLSLAGQRAHHGSVDLTGIVSAPAAVADADALLAAMEAPK